jgi:CubicO group peptidase (beta-lactamase class C family)
MIAFFAALACGVVQAQSTAVDLDHGITEQIESIVREGISDGEMPGAVVVIADSKRVLYEQVFGDRQIEPTREAMTIDTLFDLASLTKPIATATSVMRLVGQGKVDVDQPVSKYLPEFSGHGKEVITVSDLLLHIGGLIPDNSLKDYQDGPAVAWDKICALKPIAARGEKFAYTDVGFIVLGKLVERVGGKSLDRFVSDEVFVPLGMKNTRFNPNDHAKRHAAPTEQREGQWIKGEVHDPRSYLLDGVAGHAGLFSTAGDLVRYGQMMLGSGKTSSVTILKPNVFSLMTKPRTVPRGSRTFGWDHQSPYSSNRGEGLSDAAFGHGGFTGTVMWIDPEKERIFIFLSNRLHPDGKGSVNRLAGKIATLVGSVH